MKNLINTLVLTVLLLAISPFGHSTSYAGIIIKRPHVAVTAIKSDKNAVTTETTPLAVTDNEDEDDARDGAMDADRYYQKWGDAKLATCVTTFLTGGIIGLIVAIAASTTMPKEHNLGSPDFRMIRNERYRAAYMKQAKRIKSRKVWGGFALGLGLLVAFIFLLISL